MDKIDQCYLDLLGDLSSVGEVAKAIGRPVSICSCVQGMDGKLVDYAQIYVSVKGEITTSLEGLLNAGDRLSVESSLRTGISLRALDESESPDLLFGRVHEVLVQGCIASFDVQNSFVAPYAKTFEAMTGGSLSLVPLNLLDLRVVAIALGAVGPDCTSLLLLSRALGFNSSVGDRAWSKSLLCLFCLNALVARFGVDAVLAYGVGEIFSRVQSKGDPMEQAQSAEASEYRLSKGATAGAAAVALGSAGGTSGPEHGPLTDCAVAEREEPQSRPIRVPANTTQQAHAQSSPAGLAEIGDRPSDLKEYVLDLMVKKRVRCKIDESVLAQIEACMLADHFEPEKILYDAQNILISGIRDGEVDPLSLVNQSKVEMVRNTVGNRQNMMVRSIIVALTKNGVYLDPVEVVCCLKVMEDNIE